MTDLAGKGWMIARRSLVAEPAEPATWLFWLLAQGRSPKTVDQGGNFWDDLGANITRLDE